MAYRYDVVLDKHYYGTAIRHHYRRVSRMRWFRRVFFSAMTVWLAMGAVGAAQQAERPLFLFLATGAALSSQATRLLSALSIWRIRRMPGFGAEATFNVGPGGVEFESDHSSARIAWSAFSSAYRMSDGILLYRGPQFFNWLPDDRLQDGAHPEQVVHLVKQNTTDFVDRTK